MPTIAALAPSASAAATPRPSPIPPAAMIGTSSLSANLGRSANSPTSCRSAAAWSNDPRWPPASNPCAMTASAPASCARLASASVVAVANHAMPLRLQARHELRRKQPHDRRHRCRRGVHKRVALLVEAWTRDIARSRWYWRAPAREKRTGPGFRVGITPRVGVGDPRVQLKGSGAAGADLAHPLANPVGVREQRAHRAHAAGIADGNRQA